RRLDEVALAQFGVRRTCSACHEDRLALPGFDIAFDLLEMIFTDQRTHLGFTVHWIPQTHTRRHLLHSSDESLEQVLLYQHTGSGRAHFSLVDENAEERAIDRRLKIRVRKEDVRRFPSELE